MIAKPIRRTQIKRRRTGTRRSSRVLNPAYLHWLSYMACFICYREAYEFLAGIECNAVEAIQQPIYGRQKSPTEAAHVGFAGKPRGMSQKHSDDEAIPLCREHHGPGHKDSIHDIGPSAFFALHGADRDATIRMFQELWKEHCR